jgi:hypothetical protein
MRGGLDLRPGAGQPLAERAGRDQEGAGHAARVEAENNLQHQWRAQARVDRGVGADEHQVEGAVGGGARPGVRPLGVEQGEMGCGEGGDAGAAGGVGGAVPGRGDQPGLGAVGDAAAGPDLEGAEQGVGERVGRGGEIAGAGGEDGDEPAVGEAGDALDLVGGGHAGSDGRVRERGQRFTR